MNQDVRKSTLIGLSFPYDWSNPAINDEALIINVLDRGIFADVCRVCAYFGVEIVEKLASDLLDPAEGNRSLARMLNNIKKGFAHAQARQSS